MSSRARCDAFAMKLVWVAVVIAGCGDDLELPVDATIDAPVDAYLDHGTFTGTVADQVSGATIADAKVCLVGAGADQCTTSRGDGTYTLALAVPDGTTQVTGLTTAQGFLGRANLWVEHPTPDNQHEVSWETIDGLYAEAEATTYLATQAGFTYPTTTTGFVAVSVSGTDSSDHPAATATISPAAGSGPVYTDALGTPDPVLTSGGRFLFGNLPPGAYTITVQSAGRTCSEQAGALTINGQWPPTANGTLPVGITANALTVGLVVACR